MVKEGYYFGVPPLLLGAIAMVFHWWIAGVLLLAFGLFCFSFFRDPDREIPADSAIIVSPADGRVVVITEEENAGRKGTRISIFLAIWNVRVARDLAWDFADHIRSLSGVSATVALLGQDRLTGVIGRSLLLPV